MVDIYNHARAATINEEPIDQMLDKQRDITRLFPPFYDRVKKVGVAGGVHLVDEKPGVWFFEASSVSKPGSHYNIAVSFSDILAQIAQHGADPVNWNKDKTGIDLRKLAERVFDESDVRISCGCPAAQYWGFNYIQTKRRSKYGSQERRPPNVRNPRQHGMMCKHMQSVMDALPFYRGDMAGHLRRNFKKEIATVENAIKKGVPKPKVADEQ